MSYREDIADLARRALQKANIGSMRFWKRRRHSAVLLALTIAASGCTTPERTVPRQNRESTPEYRFHVVHDKQQRQYDDVFLAATFSGGGKRAAALAYGALRALRDTSVQRTDVPLAEADPDISLIKEFDFVSAVSGGSVTASYWALHGPDNLDQFDPQFLRRDMEGSLLAQLFNPANWLRLPTSSYSRLDILRDYFSKHLVKQATYGDLLTFAQEHDDRPYLVLNATDMSTGSLFPFIQLQFDLLCADLSAFPIADALAASAAYPVIFNANSLRNQRFPENGEAGTLSPGCIRDALEQELKADLDEKSDAVNSLNAGLAVKENERDEKRLELQAAIRAKGQKEKALAAANAIVATKTIALRQAKEEVSIYAGRLVGAEETAIASKTDLLSAEQQERRESSARAREKGELDKLRIRKSADLAVLSADRAELSGLLDDIESMLAAVGDLGKGAWSWLKRIFGGAQRSGASVNAREEGSAELQDVRKELSLLLWSHESTSDLVEGGIGRATADAQDRSIDEFLVPTTFNEIDVAGSVGAAQQGLMKIGDLMDRVRSYLEDDVRRGGTSGGDARELDDLREDAETLHRVIGQLEARLERVYRDHPKNADGGNEILIGRWAADIRDTLSDIEEGINNEFPELWGRVARWRVSGAEDELNRRRSEVEEQLRTANEKYNEAVRIYEAAEEEAAINLALLEERVKAAETEVRRFEDKLARAEQRRDDLIGTVEEQTTKLNMLSEEIKKAKKEVAQKELELDRAVEAVDAQEKTLAAAAAEVEKLQQDLRRLETLRKEHAAAVEYYRFQMAHYGREETQYVHLMDGGATDNLGFTPLLELLDWLFPEPTAGGELGERYVESKITKVGIVAVDARSARSRQFEGEAVAPDVFDTMMATIDAAIDSKSFLLARELERVTGELDASDTIEEKFIVKVGFDEISKFKGHGKAEDLDKCGRQFEQIATRWDLPESYLDALIDIGEALVRGSSEYRRLVGSLGGTRLGRGETVGEVCARYSDILPDIPRPS